MVKTRRSLFYLAGYLIPSGLALIVDPVFALRLLQARGDYGVTMPRLAGFILLALGVIVADIIRLRAEVLYRTTLVVRVIILAGIVLLYAQTSDPLFLVLLAVVGFGFLFTLTSYLLDGRARGRA
jgi:hypothetical protein